VSGTDSGAGGADAGDVGDAGPGDVICLLERDGAAVADASLRALAFAASLAGAASSVAAVVFPSTGGVGAAQPDGESLSPVLASSGATDVYLVHSAELGSAYSPIAWARALEQLTAAIEASAVVAAATDHGSEVMAHLGALTGLPVAANCVSVEVTGPSSWQLTRQRWAGSVLEDALLEAPCALLTVATDAVQPHAAAASPDGARQQPATHVLTPTLSETDLLVRATESAEQSSGLSLATARVVVGGGRGVGGPDGFAALEELAGLMGGVVGVSRVVTSQGWRPHRQQVGQTGTKISPELYLACGISGAIQHMAGCLSARHIVVVNTDADAPIIAHAEYAVIGDLNEVVPALIAAIRARPS
jgi:electron transfer flavoprotein alpha subunit